MRLRGKFLSKSIVYGMLARDEAQVCVHDIAIKCVRIVPDIHRVILQITRSLSTVVSGVERGRSPHVETHPFARPTFKPD